MRWLTFEYRQMVDLVRLALFTRNETTGVDWMITTVDPRGLLAALALMLPLSNAFSQTAGATPNLCGHETSLANDKVAAVCARIEFIGQGSFGTLQLIPESLSVAGAFGPSVEGLDGLTGPRAFFSFDELVISVPTTNDGDLDLVLRTAAAIQELKLTRRGAYDFIFATRQFPTAPSRADTSWKNRTSRLFISFDRTPAWIAASVTLLGSPTQISGVSHYGNFDLISIDQETIRGNVPTMGSARIYGSEDPSENYRQYMEDGLLFSLLHEAAHRYIDYRNSTSKLANLLYRSRATDNSAEEIVANETAMFLLGDRVSDAMRMEVANENALLVARPGVREALAVLAGTGIEAGMPLVVPQ